MEICNVFFYFSFLFFFPFFFFLRLLRIYFSLSFFRREREGVEWRDASLFCNKSAFNADMFALSWGSIISTVSAVLERFFSFLFFSFLLFFSFPFFSFFLTLLSLSGAHPSIIQLALSGFYSCGRIAVFYRMNDVFDNIIVTLCRFSSLLSSHSSGTLVFFSFFFLLFILFIFYSFFSFFSFFFHFFFHFFFFSLIAWGPQMKFYLLLRIIQLHNWLQLLLLRWLLSLVII